MRTVRAVALLIVTLLTACSDPVVTPRVEAALTRLESHPDARFLPSSTCATRALPRGTALLADPLVVRWDGAVSRGGTMLARPTQALESSAVPPTLDAIVRFMAQREDDARRKVPIDWLCVLVEADAPFARVAELLELAGRPEHLLHEFAFPLRAPFSFTGELALLLLHGPLDPGGGFVCPSADGAEVRLERGPGGAVVIHRRADGSSPFTPVALSALPAEWPALEREGLRLRVAPDVPWRELVALYEALCAAGVPYERCWPMRIEP